MTDSTVHSIQPHFHHLKDSDLETIKLDSDKPTLKQRIINYSIIGAGALLLSYLAVYGYIKIFENNFLR